MLSSRPIHQLILSIVALILAAASPAAADAPAVSFVPEAPLDRGAACTAYLSLTDDWAAEAVACDTWRERPASHAVVFLEHDGHISPASVPVAGRSATAERQDRISVPTAAAGTVRLDASGFGDAAVVRLLQVTMSGLAVRREVSPEDAAAGVAMPAGEVVALVWDNKRKVYLATSPPTPVRAGGETVAAVAAPASGDVLLHARAADQVLATLTDLEPRLVPGPDPAAPPVRRTRAADGLWALWRGVEPAAVEQIAGDGEATYLVPEATIWGSGRVAFVETETRSKPSIDVEISLPAALRSAPLTLEVQRTPGWRPYREEPVAADATGHRLAWLPPDTLMLTLNVPPWQFRRRADLRDGLDQTLHFAPEPIELTGTVYRGDQGAAATIDFNVNLTADKGRIRALADEDGRYEATLFRPGTYVVEVRTEGTPGQPMREILELPEQRYVEHDFRLFDGRITVEVVDQATDAPIEGAAVSFSNEAEDGQKVGINAETDEDGMAVSSELRPGKITVAVSAEGYREHVEEPLALTEDEAPALRVRLEPVGDRKTVEVALAGGRPATGAELLVLDPLNGAPIWSGTADEAGRAQVPADLGGRALLVRHVEGASAIRHVPQSDEAGALRIALALAAPALSLAVVDRLGQPVRRAGIALWIDGIRVQGAALGWLTRAAPRTDGAGLWLGTGLGRTPVRALPYALTAEAAVLGGHWDAQAQAISFPWGERSTLTLVAE